MTVPAETAKSLGVRAAKEKPWEPRHIGEAIFPISLSNWIHGMGVIEYPLGHPRLFITLIYIIALSVVYLIMIYFGQEKLERYVQLQPNNIGRIVANAILYINIGNSAIVIIMNIFYSKEINMGIRRADMVYNTLEHFEIAKGYKNTYYKLHRSCFVCFSLNCLLFTCDVIWMNRNMGIMVSLYVAIIIHHSLNISTVGDMTFIFMIGLIGTKFTQINELLCNMVKSKTPPKKAWKIVLRKNARISTLTVASRGDNDEKIKHTLQTIRHVHLELCRLSRDFNVIYGVQITGSMAVSFLIITGLLYNLYTIYASNEIEFNEKLWNIAAIGIWYTIYSAKILLLSRQCAVVSIQAGKTGEIIHEFDGPTVDGELREEIHQFALQMIQNPLIFTGCGFFTLDYTFIQAVIGAVTTYLVILIQMSGSDSNSMSAVSTPKNDSLLL